MVDDANVTTGFSWTELRWLEGAAVDTLEDDGGGIEGRGGGWLLGFILLCENRGFGAQGEKGYTV